MKHYASPRFWELYRTLPGEIRELADKNYQLLKSDSRHPSLHFKRIGELWSVRVGHHYRALGVNVEGGIYPTGSAHTPITTRSSPEQEWFESSPFSHFHAYHQDEVAAYGVYRVEVMAGSLPRPQRLLVEAWAGACISYLLRRLKHRLDRVRRWPV